MLHEAIHHYHDLLTDTLAADSQAQLERLQRLRGLEFGGRPLATVLRPRFLTPEQYRFVSDRVAALLPAFDRVYRRALADADFRRQLALSSAEEELLAHDPGFDCPCPTARFDAFFVSDAELRFTEFNAETPAGAGYNDALTDIFLGLPVMREFTRRYRVLPLPARPGVAHGLLDAYQKWLGRWEPPHIAILDWRNVPTYSEFLLFQEYFRSQGLECVIADPREVEYRDGRLFVGSIPIDLIYKRVLISELLEHCGLDHPVVRVVRERAVCMVNPFRCKLLYKKAAFAVLTDERNEALFTEAQRSAIAAHVPWTRLVEERRTSYRGQEVDLVPFVLANRERLVLKPNDDYGGKGIVLGWDVDAAAWEEAVRLGLTTPYIVQERIAIPTEPFPSAVGGQVQVLDRMLDTAPYVCHGEYVDGCLTRISTAALLNVTAGGGSTVPTFLVERR